MHSHERLLVLVYVLDQTNSLSVSFKVQMFVVSYHIMAKVYVIYFISKLESITCHTRSHSVTCHPARVNVPNLKPRQAEPYSNYLPHRDRRLS